MPEPDPSTPKTHKKHRDLHDWVATIGIPLTFAAAITAVVFTGIAARHTGRQADTADDTEKRQLRAYVALTSSFVEQFEVGRPLGIHANMKNFGVTPAFHVGTKGFMEIVLPSNETLYSIQDYRDQRMRNAATIYPGQEHTFTTYAIENAIPVTEDYMRLVQSGANVIVYYGTVYYSDIFNKQWAADYCFYYRWMHIATHGWYQCLNHQGVDDESEGDLPKR